MSMCDCFLPTEPPIGVDWWQSDKDADPGKPVRALAPHGENPNLLRWVRVSDGWAQEGAMVNYYADISRSLPWGQVGRCWADRAHPVVAVHEVNGVWIVIETLSLSAGKMD